MKFRVFLGALVALCMSAGVMAGEPEKAAKAPETIAVAKAPDSSVDAPPSTAAALPADAEKLAQRDEAPVEYHFDP